MIYKIAVIGQQCSGKTTAANFFIKNFEHHATVKIARPIYDTLKALKQEKHRAFMQQFADLAKKHFGETILVDIFEKNVLELYDRFDQNGDTVMGKDCLIVCDDIRFPYELEIVNRLGFILVAISAVDKVRKARAEKLNLAFIENHDSELLVPQLIPKADFIIWDNGISMEELGRYCNQILKTIKIHTKLDKGWKPKVINHLGK